MSSLLSTVMVSQSSGSTVSGHNLNFVQILMVPRGWILVIQVKILIKTNTSVYDHEPQLYFVFNTTEEMIAC